MTAVRVRDLCAQALAFAQQARALPRYVASGRFTPAPGGHRSRFALDEEFLLLAHYQACEGALYRSEADWERAYRLVGGFIRPRRGMVARSAWSLPGVLGPCPGFAPSYLLDQAQAALLRLGFAPRDHNPEAFSTVMVMTDACKVMDLPEPYGKWLQAKRGCPRWREEVDLELVARCDVSACAADHEEEESAVASLQLSALALTLPLALHEEVGRLLHAGGSWAGQARSLNRAVSDPAAWPL